MMNKNLLNVYGNVINIDISPISALGISYFQKNYGRILNLIPKDSKILEIGPGGAAFTQYLLYKGYENITVCEISDSSVKALKDFFDSNVEVIHGDAVDYLEESENNYDFIYAGHFIEHLSRDRFLKFLGECQSILSPGGYLIFETINCANVIYGSYLRYCDYTHMMGFTPRSLKQFILATGGFSNIFLFKIQPIRSKDFLRSLAYRRKISSRLLPKIAGNSPSSISTGRFKKSLKIPVKSIKIRISTTISRFMLGHYEFDGIKILTPFFALAARKDD